MQLDGRECLHLYLNTRLPCLCTPIFLTLISRPPHLIRSDEDMVSPLEVDIGGVEFSATVISHLFWPKPDPKDKDKVPGGREGQCDGLAALCIDVVCCF